MQLSWPPAQLLKLNKSCHLCFPRGFANIHVESNSPFPFWAPRALGCYGGGKPAPHLLPPPSQACGIGSAAARTWSGRLVPRSGRPRPGCQAARGGQVRCPERPKRPLTMARKGTLLPKPASLADFSQSRKTWPHFRVPVHKEQRP